MSGEHWKDPDLVAAFRAGQRADPASVIRCIDGLAYPFDYHPTHWDEPRLRAWRQGLDSRAALIHDEREALRRELGARQAANPQRRRRRFRKGLP